MKPNTAASGPTNTLRRIFSIALLLAVSSASVNAQTQPTADPQKAAQAEKQRVLSERVRAEWFRFYLLDLDHNGWEDPWEKAYRAYTKDKDADPDGDGIGNFEEMLDGTAPDRANKKGEKYFSPEELAKSAADAARALAENEKVWAARKEILDVFQAPAVELNSEGRELSSDEIEAVRKVKMLGLHQRVALKEQADMAAAKAALGRAGFPEQFTDQGGKTFVLGGSDAGRPFFLKSDNAVAADTISTDEVRPGGSLGLGLTGTGTRIGMWEIGDPLVGHTEYLNAAGTTNRATDKDGTQTGSTALANRWHATHVAATMMARGAFSSAKGMAQDALLHAYDTNLQFTEITGVNSNGDPNDDLQLSNHSYGTALGWEGTATDGVNNYPLWWGPITISYAEDAYFGYYDSNAQTIDQAVYTQKTYLPVWSAGNDRLDPPDVPPVNGNTWVVFSNNQLAFATGTPPSNDGGTTGYDTTANYGVGKNVLSVGSVADLTGGYTTSSGVAYTSFSAAGPTDDGRIKPDLTANGEVVTSAYDSSTSSYATSSGTSQAAPGVTGSLDLLLEHFKTKYGATRLPWASTLKGLAIHTADESGTTAGPDYRGGWGLMNTKKAAALLTDDAANGYCPFFKETYVPNGSTVTFDVKAIGGSSNPIKVTIVWSDPAGSVSTLSLDNTATKLVNDIDLRITKPDTTDALPWVLNPASPASGATQADNSKDNVEQIVIDNPTAGATYTVKIAASTGVTLVNDLGQAASQAVSVFLSGVQAEPAPLFKTLVDKTGATTYTLTWPSTVGAIYRVESSTDLTSWTTVSGDIFPITTSSTNTPASTSEPRRFWRIKRLQ